MCVCVLSQACHINVNVCSHVCAPLSFVCALLSYVCAHVCAIECNICLSTLVLVYLTLFGDFCRKHVRRIQYSLPNIQQQMVFPCSMFCHVLSTSELVSTLVCIVNKMNIACG